MSKKVYENNVLREHWNDDTQTYTAYNAQGGQVSSRAYTPAESAEAAATLAATTAETKRAQYLADLSWGINALIAAREGAEDDIAVVTDLHTQAVALAAATATQIQQMQAWTPTANLAGVTALRDALVTVAQRQKTIIDAMTQMYVYRKAVDENAVLTDNSIIWLARLASNNIMGGTP